MIGFDPTPARRPASSVLTRRGARVERSAASGDAGGDAPRQALVPVSPRRSGGPAPERASSAEGSVTNRCAASGLLLQTEMVHPRRGLRADSVERARYRAAYETAGRPAPARPALVKSA